MHASLFGPKFPLSILIQRRNLEKGYITGRGRQNGRVEARDLLCYWSALELGIPMTNLPKRLDMTISAVSYAV